MVESAELQMPRRSLLAAFVKFATGGLIASAAGLNVSARAEESKKGAVMPSILAFDVNDSMLDIQHLAPLFERLFGDRKLVDEWYAQLVLYSEAITLAGGPYTPFFNLSQAVLKMMGSIHKVSIQQADVDELRMRSSTMPVHPDVPPGLKLLKDAGFRLVTLTNSSPDAQIIQLKHAGIDGYFEKMLSIDRVRRYKPAPQTYHMAAEELNVPTSAICLVSAHLWDNVGAQNAGCQSALIARASNPPPPVLDIPWWPVPAAVGPDLPSVATQLIKLWRS